MDSVVSLLAAGRRDEATTRYEQFRHRVHAMPRNGQWLTSMKNLADAVVELEDEEVAAVVYDEMMPFGDQVVFPTIIVSGSADLPLGRLATVLGRYDDAATHLERALATHERIDARSYLACTHLELATLHCTRGVDRDRARNHVLQTLDA